MDCIIIQANAMFYNYFTNKTNNIEEEKDIRDEGRKQY